MKAFLMHRDRDFDLQQALPHNAPALIQDLELDTLFNAMALGDRFLFDVAKVAVLSGLNPDSDTILYRQAILRDCLRNPSVIRDIYQIPIDATENKRKRWLGIFSRYPGAMLSSAVEMMQMFMGLLKRLRQIADEHAHRFESEGFTTFFAMIQKELDDKYFATVLDHLRELRFRDGVMISAKLGEGNEGTNYVLRKPENGGSWVKRVLAPSTPTYSFSIHPRDEHGARALGELRDRGIVLVASALARSVDHIDSFLNMLGCELAFYVGCLNLYEQLDKMGEPVAFPVPIGLNGRRLSSTGLYDVCLALTMQQRVVGNDVNADAKDLLIVTGANQGGKSTFLRSVGLAQLMMQCGMFVPAESFTSNLCDGLFTHYKREEDATMTSGKLDDELSRMSEIVELVTPNSMVLFNESFAATNEREGSEIARQIVSALLEKGIKIVFVTHLYEFARSLYDRRMDNAIFLRAERCRGGKRTFKMIEGRPLQTSYGRDLYVRIFGTDN